MTIDLVSKARARLSEHKVNGPEGSLVSEMIKQLPQEKRRDHKMLSRLVYGVGRCAQFVEDCKACVPEKPDAALEKGTRRCRAVAWTSGMSKWYVT